MPLFKTEIVKPPKVLQRFGRYSKKGLTFTIALFVMLDFKSILAVRCVIIGRDRSNGDPVYNGR